MSAGYSSAMLNLQLAADVALSRSLETLEASVDSTVGPQPALGVGVCCGGITHGILH